MSTIREKPYIEELLASMSEQNLNDLKTILDSGGDNVNLSFATLTDSYKNKVTPVYFQFEDNGLKTGILIWTDTKCALICYHRFQDLIIFEFSPTYHTYTKIKQYCDINELRRVLDDTIEKKGAVDSGDAAEGSVPFADGEGGVTWDKPTEYIKGDDFEDAATTVKMVAIDDEGNLVKADLPEGTFVVDSALSNASENPVQNKVITEELDKIKDGRTVVGKAQTAQALDNVSENSGSTQEDPFIAQGTGTNNNTSETPTSPKAHQLEKQGNTVVVNQTTPTLTGDTYSTNDSSDYTGLTILENIYDTTSTHTWLFIVKVTSITANCEARIRYPALENLNTGINYFIKTTINNNSLRLQYKSTDGNSASITVPDDWFKSIDLTQWFGSDDNIPEYLLDHPEAFINYYNGSLAYNTRQLVSSDGRYLVTIGFNQWDEEWELGGINSTTGENESSSTRIRSKNYIRVIPNTEYYLKGINAFAYVMFYDSDKNYLGYITPTNGGNTVITTLNNATYLRFVTDTSYGTTYNHNICINLSWDGECDGEYKDFVKHVYDTGTEVLRSAGSVKDIKTNDGTIIINVGVVDLGDLTYEKFTTIDNYTLFRATISSIKRIPSTSIMLNALCSKYITASTDDRADKTVSQRSNQSTIDIIDNSFASSTAEQFKVAMSGVMLYYELATPTTEQGTPFDEIIDVDDYGTMYWLDDTEDFVEVPQGCKLFYPADYALLIDDLGNYANYDVTALAKKSDLTDLVEQEDASNNITDVAGLTYKYKKLYKTGNVITLYVVAENGTGSDIAADNTLFTLPSDYYSPTYNIKGTCVLNNNVVTSVNIAYETGNVSCPTVALESGEYVYITLTYAIE